MLMGSIYQKAELVIAWLGPEDETTDDALVVMDRLASISLIPKSTSEAMEPSESYGITSFEVRNRATHTEALDCMDCLPAPTVFQKGLGCSRSDSGEVYCRCFR